MHPAQGTTPGRSRRARSGARASTSRAYNGEGGQRRAPCERPWPLIYAPHSRYSEMPSARPKYPSAFYKQRVCYTYVGDIDVDGGPNLNGTMKTLSYSLRRKTVPIRAGWWVFGTIVPQPTSHLFRLSILLVTCEQKKLEQPALAVTIDIELRFQC